MLSQKKGAYRVANAMILWTWPMHQAYGTGIAVAQVWVTLQTIYSFGPAAPCLAYTLGLWHKYSLFVL